MSTEIKALIKCTKTKMKIAVKHSLVPLRGYYYKSMSTVSSKQVEEREAA